jgi:hypothetical protein
MSLQLEIPDSVRQALRLPQPEQWGAIRSASQLAENTTHWERRRLAGMNED